MMWDRIRHALFGHWVAGESGFDGLSFSGRCAHCGVTVLQDSQGNWFSAGGEQG